MKIGIALAAALVIALLAWKLYPRTTATANSAPASPTSGTSTTTVAPAPVSRHVTQFPSPAARTQLEQRIAQAAQTRQEASLHHEPTAPPSLPTDPNDAMMDKDAIRGAMHEVIPMLGDCYADAAPALPGDHHLSIKAKFTILGDRQVGAIIDAKQLFDENNQALPTKLDDCLRTTIQTMSLPPLGDGNTVEVDYPLEFSGG